MKPLPPIYCATAKHDTAKAMTGSCFQVSVIHPRSEKYLSSQLPNTARPTPTTTPIPISSATSVNAAIVVSPSMPDLDASARNINKIGTQIPSFYPLSKFSPSRIFSGTASFVTTALPRAASVGARMVARIAISINVRFPKIRTPTPKPKRIISGRAINKSLRGIRLCCFKTSRFALEASMNKTSARVNSASVR